MNLFDMAREGLRRELTRRAAAGGDAQGAGSLAGAAGQDQRRLHQRQSDRAPGPVPDAAPATRTCIWWCWRRFRAPAPEAAVETEGRHPRGVPARRGAHRGTRAELRAKEEYLQTTIEELETSNEELKSTNEEMQSVNEELQSTNEELETSKEELQSVNEELATVNAELQNKVADLSRANNDMNNLLAGTGIGTLFVDHQLRIPRFTPPRPS